jgi:hypothetical protein
MCRAGEELAYSKTVGEDKDRRKYATFRNAQENFLAHERQ